MPILFLSICGLSVADDYRGKSPPKDVHSTPPQIDTGSKRESPLPVPIADPRPVVEVFTLHDGFPKGDRSHVVKCKPCDSFHDWHDAQGEFYPIRFVVHSYCEWKDVPRDVMERDTGFPQFYWKKNKAGRKLGGWSGPEQFLKSYEMDFPGFQETLRQQVNQLEQQRQAAEQVKNESAQAAPVKGTGKPSADGDGSDKLLKFIGPGKFTWNPDKPVSTYVDDATVVKYSRIAATVTVTNGEILITFDEPRPEVWVRYGLWAGAELRWIKPQLNANPPKALIHTSLGERTVTLPELPELGK